MYLAPMSLFPLVSFLEDQRTIGSDSNLGLPHTLQFPDCNKVESFLDYIDLAVDNLE